MARTPQPKAQEQPEEKTFTEAQLESILRMDRYATFFSLSMNRSIAAGDPPELREAAKEIYQIMMMPPKPKPAPAEGAPKDNPDEPPQD